MAEASATLAVPNSCFTIAEGLGTLTLFKVLMFALYLIFLVLVLFLLLFL